MHSARRSAARSFSEIVLYEGFIFIFQRLEKGNVNKDAVAFEEC